MLDEIGSWMYTSREQTLQKFVSYDRRSDGDAMIWRSYTDDVMRPREDVLKGRQSGDDSRQVTSKSDKKWHIHVSIWNAIGWRTNEAAMIVIIAYSHKVDLWGHHEKKSRQFVEKCMACNYRSTPGIAFSPCVHNHEQSKEDFIVPANGMKNEPHYTYLFFAHVKHWYVVSNDRVVTYRLKHSSQVTWLLYLLYSCDKMYMWYVIAGLS